VEEEEEGEEEEEEEEGREGEKMSCKTGDLLVYMN
jgi:hypothetical protein